MKIFLIIAGFVCIGLGLIGTIVPGLPTTPFILLSAGLFMRSSEKLYKQLIKNKIFGKYVIAYERNRGMTLLIKVLSISTMWCMILISFFSIDNIYFRIFIISAGVAGTVTMGFIVKTVNNRI